MPELRILNPASTEQFADMLAALGIALPIAHSADDAGVLLDANGNEVLTVDVNNERSDADVEAIERLIILAVNTCGGFGGRDGG